MEIVTRKGQNQFLHRKLRGYRDLTILGYLQDEHGNVGVRIDINVMSILICGNLKYILIAFGCQSGQFHLISEILGALFHVLVYVHEVLVRHKEGVLAHILL